MVERCAKHDLARGPSGECVLCKRERLSMRPPSARDGSRILAFGAAGALITLAAGGLAVHRQMPPPPARRPVVEATAAPAPEHQVRVVVYTTSWCPVCKQAKKWLSANGVPFTERDVEADPQAARDRRALTSSRGVPTIDVDGQVFVGFDRNALAKAIADAKKR